MRRGRFGVVLAAVALGGGRALAQVVVPPDPDAVIDFVIENEAARAPIEVVTTDTNRSFGTVISRAVNDNVTRALRPDRGVGAVSGVPARVSSSAAPARRRAGQGFTEDLEGSLAGWTNASVALLEGSVAGAEFEGELFNPLVGGDYAADGWVFGAALGYENASFDTPPSPGGLTSDGVIFTPYVGRAIGEHVILDAGVGYARLGYDRKVATPAGTARGSFDADRVFVFVNANGYLPPDLLGVDALQLVGRVGFTYSHEDQEGFRLGTEVVPGGTVELGQVKIGAEARYYLDDTGIGDAELFTRAEGRIDAIRSDESFAGVGSTDDRTDVLLGVGAALAVTERVTADLAYERAFGRDDLDEQSVVFGLRIAF